MRLIDIDNLKGFELPQEDAFFLMSKYPPQAWPEMYDTEGDMCLDEKEYEDMKTDLQFVKEGTK